MTFLLSSLLALACLCLAGVLFLLWPSSCNDLRPQQEPSGCRFCLTHILAITDFSLGLLLACWKFIVLKPLLWLDRRQLAMRPQFKISKAGDKNRCILSLGACYQRFRLLTQTVLTNIHHMRNSPSLASPCKPSATPPPPHTGIRNSYFKKMKDFMKEKFSYMFYTVNADILFLIQLGV